IEADPVQGLDPREGLGDVPGLQNRFMAHGRFPPRLTRTARGPARRPCIRVSCSPAPRPGGCGVLPAAAHGHRALPAPFLTLEPAGPSAPEASALEVLVVAGVH